VAAALWPPLCGRLLAGPGGACAVQVKPPARRCACSRAAGRCAAAGAGSPPTPTQPGR
jgi:hypothetical protein